MPVQIDMPKGGFQELFHRVRLAGRDHIIVRLVLLQHQPHGLDVITGKAPVTARIEIPQPQFIS